MTKAERSPDCDAADDLNAASVRAGRKFNLFGPEFKANPHPTYAAMREVTPVHKRTSADGQTNIWFITRYDDAVEVLRDHRRFVKNFHNTLTPQEQAAQPSEPALIRLLSNHMINFDPPDHTRLRALVNRAFTAQIVEQMAPRIQTIADELLDKVVARGEMDLVEEYAFPLPIIVIAELLGIPPRDRNRFRTWSHAFVSSSSNVARSAKKLAKAGRQMEDFTTYLRVIFEERRRAPQDDLITSLLQAEEGGDSLSEEELFSMVILLVVTGHETTVNLISNGVLALLQQPDALRRLKEDPGLLPQAVEELARFCTPVERATMRFAAEDVVLHGQRIARGDAVSVVLAGANRDPDHFSNSDCLDIARDPNRHLAFGLGIHYCLGAPLGRMEGRIAIDRLLQRLSGLRLAVDSDELRWSTNPIMRGLQHLPVAWDRA